MTKNIPINGLFGIFYVRKANEIERWVSYYKTVDALRSLFEDEEFNKTVDGFYLNIHGNFDIARISYFISPSNDGKEIPLFREFFKRNGIVEAKKHESPRNIVLAQNYGGAVYEQRYRNFLVKATQVGLDLMKRDLLQARILFAIYRWQVKKAALPTMAYLEPTFRRFSPTYNSMSEEEKKDFFLDLDEWPNSSKVDWAHTMVNLVLGADWNDKLVKSSYLTPGEPLAIPRINELVSDMGFQVPLDWKP